MAFESIGRTAVDPSFIAAIGNESVPKIMINNTISLFLNRNHHFGHFKPWQFPRAV